MKILVAWLGGGVLAAAVAQGAEERFSRVVRPEDFAAAGLAKLTPDELARLDALVGDYQSGVSIAARRDTDPSSPRSDAARPQPAATPKGDSGLIARARALLPAGTAVEYAAIESRIAGEFTGWQGRAIFTLENGQRWRMANAGQYYTPTLKNPVVKITPAALGAFWLTIEGVKQRVKVVPVESER